jgi:hypothetical protein
MPRATRTRQLTWLGRLVSCHQIYLGPRYRVPKPFFPPTQAFHATCLAPGRHCHLAPNVASNSANHARHKLSSWQATNSSVRESLLKEAGVPVDRFHTRRSRQTWVESKYAGLDVWRYRRRTDIHGVNNGVSEVKILPSNSMLLHHVQGVCSRTAGVQIAFSSLHAPRPIRYLHIF